MLQQTFGHEAGCQWCGEERMLKKRPDKAGQGKVGRDAFAVPTGTTDTTASFPDSAIQSRNCAIWQLFGIK
jgi:hypothetical protein